MLCQLAYCLRAGWPVTLQYCCTITVQLVDALSHFGALLIYYPDLDPADKYLDLRFEKVSDGKGLSLDFISNCGQYLSANQYYLLFGDSQFSCNEVHYYC